MALTETQLLTSCAEFTLHHTHQAELQTLEELQTSGATRLVMALRVFRLQRAILAVGMFSMFEAVLQSKLNWVQPFSQLDAYLRKHNRAELASDIDDYRVAINVLKHGVGPSHTKLMARVPLLDFKVRASNELFGEEGDVSEIDILVDADDKFVRRCARLIEEASIVIRAHEQEWF